MSTKAGPSCLSSATPGRTAVLLSAALVMVPAMLAQRPGDDHPAADPVELQLVPDESVLAADVSATGHSFVAHVTQFTATLRLDRQTGLPAAAQLRFDLKHVTTGNATRDREMLEWLEYSTFPYAEARLVSLEETAGGVVARCMLRMHGQEHEVAATVSTSRHDGGVTIEGGATIDHRRWGLPKIRRVLFLAVDPNLNVRFRLRFAPATPGAH
jgi:polyisoprenoid-binding protein YceI